MPNTRVTVRHAEPDDYRAVHLIYASLNAIRGTMQLPFPSVEMWHKRLAEPPADFYSLVACLEDEVIGHLGLNTTTRPRRRHVGSIGMQSGTTGKVRGQAQP